MNTGLTTFEEDKQICKGIDPADPMEEIVTREVKAGDSPSSVDAKDSA